MDYFSGANPDLISNKSLKELNIILQHPTVEHPTLASNFSGFYSDYIQPNIFPIIIFVLISVYLFIKYVLKRDKDENENDSKDNNHAKKHKHHKKSNKKMMVENLPYEDIMDEYYDEPEYNNYYEQEPNERYNNEPNMEMQSGGRSIDDLAKMIFN